MLLDEATAEWMKQLAEELSGKDVREVFDMKKLEDRLEVLLNNG